MGAVSSAVASSAAIQAADSDAADAATTRRMGRAYRGSSDAAVEMDEICNRVSLVAASKTNSQVLCNTMFG